MLRDLYFYPLAVIIIGGMIAFALSFGGGEALSDNEIIEMGWSLDGPSLRNLNVSPGTELSYLEEEGGFVRLSAFTPFNVGPASIGVFASLSPDFERAFAGRDLRISLRVRTAPGNGLDGFDTAYFPIESAPSAWQVFDLTPNWQDVSYTFRPPIVAAPPNTDLIALFPGKEGESREMDLARIRIQVISENE